MGEGCVLACSESVFIATLVVLFYLNIAIWLDRRCLSWLMEVGWMNSLICALVCGEVESHLAEVK